MNYRAGGLFPDSSIILAGHRGSALLITLAFIVLVTVAILAFFSQTRATLVVSSSVPARVGLEALSQSAIEATISDLRLEMLAGAETDAARADFNSLDPMVVRRPWAMVPARVISAQVPASGFEHLVKQSLNGQPFYPGTNPAATYKSQGSAGSKGSERAAAINTLTDSPNGRRLSAKRWDSVALTESAIPDTALPDWIYATRDGIPENAVSHSTVVSDASPANADYVTGRYAYNIYDVGGLLNLNAAGAPQAFAAEASRKGSLAWGDLKAIGLSADQISQIVNFRNIHSKNIATFSDLIREDAERLGFLEPLKADAGYDGFFHTRKDMLRFFLNLFGRDSVRDCTTAERNIMASFAHDLRFLTAPSWEPDSDRPKIAAASSGGNDSQGLDDTINPNLSAQKFVVSSDNEFTRLRYGDSGNPTREVSARKGEPFLNSRFSLSRLALLTRAATAAQDSPIERYFGLTRSSEDNAWVYEHGGNGKILTLSEVRALASPREPDMVELLKAAIVAGSLGKSAGVMTAGGTTSDTRDQSLDGQVVQIFANLIDQFDANGYPTEIQFDDSSFYGVENLPYLTRIKTFLVRMLPDTNAFAANQPYEIAFLPEVWNPHDLDPPSESPADVRVVADTRIPGLEEPTLFPLRLKDNSSSDGSWQIIMNAGFTPETRYVDLSADVLSSKEPILIKSGFPSSAVETPNPGGIHTDQFTVAYAPPDAIGFQYYAANTYPGITFAMEYKSSDGAWHRYFERQFLRSADATTGGSAAARGCSSPAYYLQQNNCRTIAPDPRSDRFSSYRIQELDSAENAYTDGSSLRPDQHAGYGFVNTNDRPLGPDSSRGWTLGAAVSSNSSALALGTILQNTTSSATRYTDPDGVLRPGDGALATGNGEEGQMYWPGNHASRPIILNRAFRSVGEMGYSFRGTPCRSLDFFSTKSGDAALLDFFTANESPDDGITGGRISINSANVNILTSLLSGALAEEDAGSTVTNDRAEEAAESLVNLIKDTGDGGGPLLNRTELVTRWLGDESRMPIGSNSERIKRQREVFIRALAETAETRTWNLLIDLIVQTGRIPRDKTALDQFLVESERHVWVHLAIDRLTGRVLHLSQEPADD